MPVAETFTFEDSNGMSLGDVARIDTLVTVVDGSKFLSYSVISECDLINKCDLISVDEKGRKKKRHTANESIGEIDRICAQ